MEGRLFKKASSASSLAGRNLKVQNQKQGISVIEQSSEMSVWFSNYLQLQGYGKEVSEKEVSESSQCWRGS